LLVVTLAVTLGPALAQEGGSSLYDPVQFLAPEVVSVRPHDTTAWTQGLLLHNGFLYESAGLEGESTLRKVDPATGEVVQSIDIPAEYYAEGLALVDNTLIQLTYTTQVAFVYNLDTFEQIGTFAYEGEGWGLCADDKFIYMSNGSPFLQLRDRETFDLIFSGLVTAQGGVVNQLNELECVGDYIYANVYLSDFIVKIDKRNGVVVAIVDAANLLTPEEHGQLQANGGVLNGIAYLPDTDTFLITGKHWPTMFEVRFVDTGM
jgi:glutaminyl-peptide cyclotransferase